jgi:hypothetical protein
VVKAPRACIQNPDDELGPPVARVLNTNGIPVTKKTRLPGAMASPSNVLWPGTVVYGQPFSLCCGQQRHEHRLQFPRRRQRFGVVWRTVGQRLEIRCGIWIGIFFLASPTRSRCVPSVFRPAKTGRSSASSKQASLVGGIHGVALVGALIVPGSVSIIGHSASALHFASV